MARAIDKDYLLTHKRKVRFFGIGPDDESWGYAVPVEVIENAPTLTPPDEWVSVEDRLPELPKEKYCWVCVLGCRKSSKRCTPMLYERTVVRGKTVERWRDMEDRITHELPDYWMPLPEPPDRRPPEGEEET